MTAITAITGRGAAIATEIRIMRKISIEMSFVIRHIKSIVY